MCSTFARTLPKRRLRARWRLVRARPGFAFSFHHPMHAGGFGSTPLRVARVALVAIHRRIILADQIRHQLRVVHLARGHARRVHEPALRIDADVRLHAEIPPVSLLRLAHLGIALLRRILRRRRRRDQRRIHDRCRRAAARLSPPGARQRSRRFPSSGRDVRARKLRIVVSSGIASRPSSRSANARIDWMP